MIEMLWFLIPVIAGLAIAKIFFGHALSPIEMVIQIIPTAVVLLVLFLIGGSMQTGDTKFVNGIVTELDPDRQSCPSGWRSSRDSFCTEYRTRRVKTGQTCSTSNGKRTCTNTYRTDYKSIYSWERRYFVRTDIRSFEINRVDRQGVNTPPRFTSVSVGDPVTMQVRFTNYIKGASDSLFNEQFVEVAEVSYPRVSDYYRSNRVIYANYPVKPDFWREWNEQLANANSAVRKTGGNAIILVTGHDQAWAERLAQGWDAHNINDVIVVLGVKDDILEWVDVRSWSASDMVNIVIRDELLNLGVLDKDKITSIIQTAIQENFTLRSMDEFEYLAEDIEMPMWVFITAFIILLVVTPAITYVFIKHVDL